MNLTCPTTSSIFRKGTTLVEMLIVLLLVAILTTASLLKTFDSYNTGVIYIKKETATALNKGVLLQYARNFVMDDAFVQSIVPTTNDAGAHYDALLTLLDALQHVRRNATTTYPSAPQIYTSDTFDDMRHNLESLRFRSSSAETGYLRLSGTSHKNLEVLYIPGEAQN